jgi:hypothetical protein
MLEIMELDVLVTPTHQSTNHWRHTSGLGPLANGMMDAPSPADGILGIQNWSYLAHLFNKDFAICH